VIHQAVPRYHPYLELKKDHVGRLVHPVHLALKVHPARTDRTDKMVRRRRGSKAHQVRQGHRVVMVNKDHQDPQGHLDPQVVTELVNQVRKDRQVRQAMMALLEHKANVDQEASQERQVKAGYRALKVSKVNKVLQERRDPQENQ
jgi:hypothetical protein